MLKLFRRDFLKYTAAGTSVLALDHYMGGLASALTGADKPYVNRNTGKRVRGIPTTCAGCGAGCGIIAYVHDGVLMKLKGNPAHPVNKGKLCIVGEAAVYSYYDPERITSPMKRTGKRGEAEFKQISWDEAVGILSDRMKASRGKLVIESRGGHSNPASAELAGLFKGKLVSHGQTVSPAREKAMDAMFGSAFDVPDIAHASLVVNFGANPYASDPFGVATASAIATRKADTGELKLITFDPRLSETAGRSDEWIPLLPGTDGVVALAMANVIMAEGLYNARFIEKNTNTKVTALKAHIASHTPEAAERMTGVKAEDIRRIAVQYAKTDRAVVLTGSGVSAHGHGYENERAVRLLPAITGKLNRPGCNIVVTGSPQAECDMTPSELYSGILGGRISPAAYIIHDADPAYGSPETDKMAARLADEKALPFIAVIDTHITDTAAYADLVLPMTTWLEEYAVEYGPGPDGWMLASYRQPVIEPTEGTRPYLDIMASAARKAGMPPGFRSAHSYAEARAVGVKEMPLSSGLAKLEKDGFYSSAKHGSGGAIPSSFGTKSGKVILDSGGDTGLPSVKVSDALDTWKDGEFALVNFSPVGYREGMTENNLLLKELNHVNVALINPDAGRALGLKNRDKVVLSSSAGRIELAVLLSPGVQRNSVCVAEGCGHKGYGRIEHGKRFRSADPFTHAIWWGEAGEGANPNRVLCAQSAPKPGSSGWSVAKVTLQRA